MKKSLKGMLLMLPGLILAIGIKTVFSPCVHADGSVSTCAACGNWIFGAAVAMAAFAALRAFLPQTGKNGTDILLVLLSLCIFLMPMLLPTCMMQSMRCNTIMKPAVWLISFIGIMIFVITLIKDFRKGKEKNRA